MDKIKKAVEKQFTYQELSFDERQDYYAWLKTIFTKYDRHFTKTGKPWRYYFDTCSERPDALFKKLDQLRNGQDQFTKEAELIDWCHRVEAFLKHVRIFLPRELELGENEYQETKHHNERYLKALGLGA